MEVITLKEFLNNNLANYAFYKVLTQIPNAMDGLTVTQRKIIWSLLNRPIAKHKTAQIYSYVVTDTLYTHGTIGVEATANNLAASFKNNLNLIEPYGTFGYRTNPAPAGARYTEVMISPLSLKIFDKRDNLVLEKVAKQYFEGQEIEPYYLLPIIPLSIVNGNKGIAVGYSSNILGRNPIDVYNVLLEMLKGEKTRVSIDELKPWIPYFSGRVEYERLNDGKIRWLFYGVFERNPRQKKIITVTELPPGYTKESYEERVLIPLKEEGVIRSWVDNSRKNDFYYEIKFNERIDSVSDNELYEMLGLISKQTETITFVDRIDGKLDLLVFNNIIEYLKYWVKRRIEHYDIRRQLLIEQIEKQLVVITNRMRFIQDVIDRKIIIEKRSKDDIFEQLKKAKYLKIDDSYDYLLNMKIYNLTKEKIEELANQIQSLEDERARLQSSAPQQLWIEDLKSVEKLITDEVASKSKQ